ncbi:MAG: hemolysin III family protein [Coriobacteriales bacterium]|nr:hemolysin III family protein [Coriobacteriales bacterium]
MTDAEAAEKEQGKLAWFEAVKRKGKQYSVGEEIGNAVSHGVGAGLSVAALVLLIIFGARTGNGLALCGAIMFGVGLVLEYLFSTLYHAIQPPRAKAVLRIFDHSAIYLLIAGSYAPFCLVTLVNDDGITLCIVIWAIAIIGILAEVFLRERQPKWLSSVIYLAMGWAIVFKLPVLLTLLPAGGIWLLIAGGISYSLGVVFYLLKRIPYAHMVWHLFVLGGSICHFFAVILYVL